jgi:hypothetical protein
MEITGCALGDSSREGISAHAGPSRSPNWPTIWRGLSPAADRALPRANQTLRLALSPAR